MDRRRNGGPEGSVRPLPEPSLMDKEGLSKQKTILDENYRQSDGRYPEQLRPMTIRMGIISRAAGSLYLETGHTKLVCSVYGPRSTSARTVTGRSFQTCGNVSCEINFAPFSDKEQRRAHAPEELEEDLASLLLHSICPAIRRDTFPNSFVDIYITVLENDGSILANSIVAASLALIQARIEMIDSIVACSAVLCPKEKVLIIDPSAKEVIGPVITIAMMPNLGQITQLHLTGSMTSPLITESISVCTDGARAIYEGVVLPQLEAL